jgi:hypothetical protein
MTQRTLNVNFPQGSLGPVTQANFVIKILATQIEPIYHFDTSGDFALETVDITTSSHLFNITVSTASVFEKDLASQMVEAGEKLIYTLPKIIDFNGYQAHIIRVSSLPKISFMKLNSVDKEN